MSRTRRRTPPDAWNYGNRRMDAGESVYHSTRCEGKTPYPTRAKAKKAKRRLRKSHGRHTKRR